MLKLQLELSLTLSSVAALAACCFQGSHAAWAAGECGIVAALPARTDASRNCPPSKEVNAALGIASDLVMQMHYQNAVETLQPLSDMNCDARVSLLLAAALEGQGDGLKATGVLQRAHSVWPSDNSISVSLAREYLNAGKTDEAVASLNQFHANRSTRPQEMKMAALVYLSANKLKSALGVADVAYRVYPSLDTLLLLANVLQLEGRYPDVNRILGSKRDVYADSSRFLITLAESEYDASIYVSARKDIERAILLDGSAFQAHYILGNILVKQSDLNGAIEEHKEAIRLNPNEARTYYHLALILRRKMDIADEENTLEQALNANDHYAPAHCELGKLLLDQNRIEEAVNHLTLAIRYNPRSEEAYYLLVRAYKRQGETEKAREMVNRLEAVRKENQPSTTNKLVNDAASRVATHP
jgi:tetratricopeptide (TPR) repeat protein